MSNGRVTLVITPREERLAGELDRLYDAALLVVEAEEDLRVKLDLLRRTLDTITDDDGG